jgi:hypothetical protein
MKSSRRVLLTIAAIATLGACSSAAQAALVCENFTYGEYAVWRIGDSSAVLDQIDTDGDLICYAMGNELTYIQRHLVGLRGRMGLAINGDNAVQWQGDDAAFILENL